MNHEVETLLYCPVCGEQYLRGSAKTVSTNSKYFLVHIICPHCMSATLAMVSKSDKNGSVVTMGILTDLNYEEASEMMQMQPISVNEVLDIYKSFN